MEDIVFYKTRAAFQVQLLNTLPAIYIQYLRHGKSLVHFFFHFPKCLMLIYLTHLNIIWPNNKQMSGQDSLQSRFVIRFEKIVKVV